MFFTCLTRQHFNSIHLGISFFLNYTPDYCLMNLQKLMSVSIRSERPDYNVDGYIIVGLVYSMVAISLLIAPAIVSSFGTRTSLVLAAACNTGFTIVWSLESELATYLGTILNGIACALLWVGQGHYLVLNSQPETAAQHGSIFWAFYGLSLVSGNVYVSTVIWKSPNLDFYARRNIMTVMIALSATSILFFSTLQPPKKNSSRPKKLKALDSLKMAYEITISKEFSKLLHIFCFNGYVVAFCLVVPNAIGFTDAVGSLATLMVPLSSVMYGAGTVSGSVYSSLMGRYKRAISCHLWVGLALFVLSIIGLAASLPNAAAFDHTNETSLIKEPQPWLLLLCTYLMGVADSFYNTHVYRILAYQYPNYSVESTAAARLVRTVSTATFLFLCPFIGFYVHTIIVFVGALTSAISLQIVEINICKNEKSKNEPAPNATPQVVA